MAALGVVAAIASLAGTAVSAIGSLEAGKQTAQADEANAAIQQQNQQIATSQANAQAAIDKQATERQEGQIAATYGAAGIDPTQGSPLQVMADQASTGEVTRQLDLYRGTVQASSAATQSQLLTTEAKNAQTAGEFSAAGTLLTGIGRTAQIAQPLLSGSGSNPTSTSPGGNFNNWVQWSGSGY